MSHTLRTSILNVWRTPNLSWFRTVSVSIYGQWHWGWGEPVNPHLYGPWVNNNEAVTLWFAKSIWKTNE